MMIPINLKECNVAIIADTLTYTSLKDEFNALYIEPDTWKNVFTRNKIDFFFCESAWYGIDLDTCSWQYKIIWTRRRRNWTLRRIINYCRKKGIPTIFFNKEDPLHFHDFIRAAKLFDFVFTTAVECIELYKKHGVKKVYETMFSVQPKLFNPLRSCERTNDVVFAGSYYHDKPERAKDFHIIFGKLESSGYRLIIYNRQSNNECEGFKIPERYEHIVLPSVPYADMAQVYKRSKYAININSVKDSETMFSRRIFELIASGTYVISNHSLGMERIFPELIRIIDENSEEKIILPVGEEWWDIIVRGLRIVFNNYTCSDMLNTMLRNMGFFTSRPDQIRVMVFAVCNNEENEKLYFDLFKKFRFDDKKLSLIRSIEEADCDGFTHFIILNEKLDYGTCFILDLALGYKYVTTNTVISYNDNEYFTLKRNIEVDIFYSLFPSASLIELRKSKTAQVIIEGEVLLVRQCNVS